MENITNKKEVNWEYKVKVMQNRHETIRILGIAAGVVTVLCSLIWAMCLYNLEALKHPVQYNNSVEIETNYQRN
jgi:hypothetical protein